MTKKKAAHSSAQALKELGEAFADLAEGKVCIPQRNGQELTKFLEKLAKAKQATRRHNIRFG